MVGLLLQLQPAGALTTHILCIHHILLWDTGKLSFPEGLVVIVVNKVITVDNQQELDFKIKLPPKPPPPKHIV